MLGEIKKHLPKGIAGMTYYEPFVGAGAVFFDLQPGKAVISDVNEQLMLTYIVIKDHIEDLIELLNEHQSNHNNDYYYRIRDMDRDSKTLVEISDAEKAARLIYLNKTCYNGLYRVNSSGFFNVPIGRYNNPVIFNEAALREINRYLNSSEIKILTGDFESTLNDVGVNSFIYLDPPYYNACKTGFTSYQQEPFGKDQQIRLRDVIQNLTDRGVKCLLSNSDTDFIRGIYSSNSFEIFPVKAARAVNSNPSARGDVFELLIKNWKE